MLSQQGLRLRLPGLDRTRELSAHQGREPSMKARGVDGPDGVGVAPELADVLGHGLLDVAEGGLGDGDGLRVLGEVVRVEEAPEERGAGLAEAELLLEGAAAVVEVGLGAFGELLGLGDLRLQEREAVQIHGGVDVVLGERVAAAHEVLERGVVGLEKGSDLGVDLVLGDVGWDWGWEEAVDFLRKRRTLHCYIGPHHHPCPDLLQTGDGAVEIGERCVLGFLIHGVLFVFFLLFQPYFGFKHSFL